MDRHPELPKDLKYLAWLDLDSQEGREYWEAMNLMGRYASANHECIHRHVAAAVGARAVAYVENHHNFAWKERHDPGDGGGERELIVHRKGATPAGRGVLGMIPGSMAAPGFVVRGRGGAGSLRSASHGAGRVMSRTKAKETFAWGNVNRELKAKNVHVISAGIDEVPGVYKDIHQVMAQQADLVEVVARFDPRLVKMAPAGERAED
jgi:tRNA-splicing ligase RtcB